MTRASMPVVMCDFEDGCDAVVTDFYEQCASAVGGTRITAAERAPGWRTLGDEDYCPEHKPPAPSPTYEKGNN